MNLTERLGGCRKNLSKIIIKISVPYKYLKQVLVINFHGLKLLV